MNCDETRTVLVNWVLDDKSPAPDLQSVAEHLAGCRSCRTSLRRFASDVLSDGSQPMPCAECRARLPEYVNADDSQRARTAGLAAVKRHVDACPTCLAQLQELESDMVAIPLPQVRVPSFEPAGDKRFRYSQPIYLRFSAPSLHFAPAAQSFLGCDLAQVTARNRQPYKAPQLGIHGEVCHSVHEDRLLMIVTVLDSHGRPAVGALVSLLLADGSLCASRYVDAISPTIEFQAAASDEDYLLGIEYRGQTCEFRFSASGPGA